jgi:pimeloyl-ACP methyl ester carboxylesterase
MLYVERSGDGPTRPPVVLLHGLTATHRYVVMGSRSLQRAGHDVVAYDARGHGASDPAPAPEAYTYEDLAQDLLSVLDEAGFERAVLAGASMGAHTALRLALDHPERVAGLVVVTPAYDPESWPGDLVRWDALSEGLRRGGVDGFVEAYGDEGPEKWRATLQTVLRQRLSAHDHPEAVADALRAVPRSRPFAARDDLRSIAAPTVVVADRDEPDPGHPLAVGELYASLIPGARLVVEEEGQSPIAWQGGQLSKVIAAVAAEAGLSVT